MMTGHAWIWFCGHVLLATQPPSPEATQKGVPLVREWVRTSPTCSPMLLPPHEFLVGAEVRRRLVPGLRSAAKGETFSIEARRLAVIAASWTTFFDVTT